MMKKIFCLGAFLTALLPASSFAGGTNTYSLGVEGFKDTYKESSLDVTDKTNYGSITGYYAHQSGRVFGAVDIRASYGSDKYSSPSGVASGAAQWEFDNRLRVGFTTPLWGGQLSPYIGIGWRYFQDQGKGLLTSLNAAEYDRRISQFYIPIGSSLTFATEDGWSITPMAEADLMFYGNVDSRLTNNQFTYIPEINSYVQFKDNANNTQSFGYGGRGEIMFGKAFDGYSLQVGPFIRYWHVSKSSEDTFTLTSSGGGTSTGTLNFYEPENTRTQVGVTTKFIW